MRTATALWALYLTDGDADALISSVSTMSASADYDGSGSISARTYIRGSSNIATTASAISAAANPGSIEWVGGLFKAADEQATYLGTQTALSSTGSGGSTFASRVAAYGTAGSLSTEVLVGASDTATWAVLSMLVDDLDSTSAGRTALLNSSVT